MNRTFEDRKPTKVYAKSRENKSIIQALNIYGRVPEQHELLEEIEKLNKEKDDLDNYNRHLHNENKRLNNIINELEKYFAKPNKFIERPERMKILDKLKTLKEGK